MTLDSGDAMSSVLQTVKSEVGLKLFAAFFVLQVVNIAVGLLSTLGTTGQIAASLVSIIAAVIGVVLTIGAFRALDSGTLREDYFTDNIFRPFLRIAGTNIVTTAFLFIAFLPAVIGVNLGIAGTVIGVPVSLVAAIYVILSLLPALAEVAVDDRRMFESLDRSVKKSWGEKISMLKAALPLVALYMVTIVVTAGLTVAGATGNTPSGLAGRLATSALGSITTVTLYATLIEYHHRLI